MYIRQSFLTETHVDLLNRVNLKKFEVSSSAWEALTPFLGKKVIRADKRMGVSATPTAVFSLAMNEFASVMDGNSQRSINDIRVSWQCSDYSVQFSVEGAYCFASGARQRISASLAVAGIADRKIQEIYPICDKPIILTLEQVLALDKQAQELETELAQVKRILRDFT